MGENSKIEWTHHTFNPWRGCVKVSPGCDHCYAERQSKRNPGVLGVWGADGVRVPAADSYWAQPVSWDRKAAAAGERRRVFCASLADVCEILPQGHPSEGVVEAGRLALMSLIALTPHLDWLLLTKRPQNAHFLFPDWWRDGWPRHVWLGVSVEDQRAAAERIPLLLQIPAAVRFLSCGPLLGSVDVTRWMRLPFPVGIAPKRDGTPFSLPAVGGTRGIDWVICEGESGPGARPMNEDWVRSIRDQCVASGTAFFYKQRLVDGQKVSLPMLDGRQWAQFPEVKP